MPTIGNKNDLHNNASGYPDPTAYNAIKNIVRDEKVESKAAFLLQILKYIIRESGFELLNRIELRDKRSGRTFK